jgi:hypothetical protein
MSEFSVTMSIRLTADELKHIETTANEMRCSIEDRISDLVTTAIQHESVTDAHHERTLTVEPSPLEWPLDNASNAQSL